MSDDGEDLVARIAAGGRTELTGRLRTALRGELAAQGGAVSEAQIEEHVVAAVARAGGTLWRRALAEAARGELGLTLGAAARHPAVRAAHALVGAPPYDEAPTEAEILRVPAVHEQGLESLRGGEDDLELRFSPSGVDVLKRSTGATIGRLEWSRIVAVELPPARRGLRARRRRPELHVVTDRGRATFTLPEMDEDRVRAHLEPILTAAREGGGAA